MKTIIKSFAAILVLSGILNAGGVTLIGAGAGAGVNVLGLEVGAGVGVNVGLNPVYTTSQAVYAQSEREDCVTCVSKTCCFKVKSNCPPFLYDEAQVEERVITVEEYYMVEGCPVCVSCK